MTFSASRVTTWLNCNRKAGWTYICGYEDPGNADTDFGTQVHAELEAAKSQPGYLPNRLTEVGAVASEALPHVEDFTLENAKPEGEFAFKSARHKWRGFIDLRKPGSVVDYKTTSDFKWAKTAEALLHDPQAVLYAAYEFTRWSGDAVDVMWLYLRKRYPYRAKPVRLQMTRAHTERAFGVLESIADEFQAAADAAPKAPDARHKYVLDVLQPNYCHCDAYRGCPHRARCNLSFFGNHNNQDPTTGDRPMDLLSRLQAMDEKVANGHNPLARGEEAPMIGLPSPIKVSNDQATGRPVLAFAPGGAFSTVKPVVQETASGPTTFNPGFLEQPDAPDAPDAPPAAELSPDTIPVMLAAEDIAANPGAAINPPKRRGRPPKAKAPEAVIAAEPITLIPPAMTPDPAPQASTNHRIGTLFVGCMMRGAIGAPADFDSLIAKAKIAIGPQDYRLYEYGKGNGMLLQMFEAIVQHERPTAVVVADARCPEAILCLSHLRSISDTVVEALSR